jgi:hypothetical protein
MVKDPMELIGEFKDLLNDAIEVINGMGKFLILIILLFLHI